MRYVPDPRDLVHALLQRAHRARACCLSVVILALLLVLGSCAALGWGAARVAAAPGSPDDETASGTDVVLLIDHSQSLYDQGEPGSDPEQLRLQGARWLAGYLALPNPDDDRLAIVYFGTAARLIVPLTEAEPAASLPLQDPGPMGWTNFDQALGLAFEELVTGPRARSDRHRVVILLTDGLPQEPKDDGAEDPSADAVRRHASAFAEADIDFLVLLLDGPGGRDTRRIAEARASLWHDLALRHDVEVFPAASADALAEAYHAIALRLRGQRTTSRTAHEPVPPTQATPHTTVTATSSATPNPMPPLDAPNTTLPPNALPNRRMPWQALGVALLLIGVAIVGGTTLRRHRTAGPRLEGRLRLVATPDGRAHVGQTWDLGAYRSAEVEIGSTPSAHVLLPDAELPAIIARLLAKEVDGEAVVELRSADSNPLRVNGLPAVPGQPLAHGDQLTFGGYQLRYENVLRTARRRPAHATSLWESHT